MRTALLACLLAASPCFADEDEAWLHRADVPAGTRPLLAVLLDRSTDTAAIVDAPAPFDPLLDHGAGLPAGTRCESTGLFGRRGPGAAPDCHRGTVIEAPACAAARVPLAAYGFFVAPPALAAECGADLLYTGNYLNYLQSAPAPVSQPLATLLAERLADALAATAELDVKFLATGDAPLEETLAEAAGWLRNETGQSPFESACRPVSLALLAATGLSEDAQRIANDIATTDLREDLPGIQSAPVSVYLPGAGFETTDPLAWPNLVAAAFQHDAAVPANPQLSAAGLVPADADSRGPGVILGLSAPQARARWRGNLFRYGLRAPASPLEPPVIVDRDGDPAVDPASGLPFPHTRSLWSDAPDSDLLAGGAAGRLPPPDARRLLSGSDLPGLGDPGLHAPLVVEDSDGGRSVVLAATQDGFLHAFDAESGVEQWAWMPDELLHRLPELQRDAPAMTRSHGIDGALVLHRDRDGEGHRWLLFGLGRGGAHYYALDLADLGHPRLLWSFALPDAAVQARGEPVVTRLRIAGSGQSAGDRVVLLPGGYDTRFDAPDADGPGAGDALHVVDAVTGRLLWSLDGFTTLPSAPRVLDLDGDGHLDRAYLIDATGNLWRIDFTNGAAAAELATPRRVARLGTGAHRFFATPDASVVQMGGISRLAIAVGSGTLTRPRDASLVDRAYVLFDTLTGAAAPELEEDDLFDATDTEDALPPDARGWFVRLESHGAGEKVVGPGVTFDHVLRFQTYQPLPPEADAPCGPPRAVARRYAIDLRTARPASTAVDSEEDEPEEVAVSGLPPALRFGFEARWEEPCESCRSRPFGIAGGATFDPGYAGDPVRTSWRKRIPPPASP